MANTTALEAEIVKALLSKRGEITVVIPDKMDPSKIHDSLKALLKGIDDVDRKISKCKPLIGRLMVLARENPATYEDLGHEKFEDYVSKELEPLTGMSRSWLWECKAMIEKWPNLTMEQYALYRTNKLLLLGKVTNQSESGYRRLLGIAEKRTYEELKQYLVDAGLLGKGDADGANLIVTGTKSQIKELKSFLTDERAVAHCGTDHYASMILKAFEENSTEWGMV